MRSRMKYSAFEGDEAPRASSKLVFDRAAFGETFLNALALRKSSYRKAAAEIGIPATRLCRIARGIALVDAEAYLRISHWLAKDAPLRTVD